MNLGTLLTKNIDRAWGLLSTGVLRSVTYQAVARAAYDPATGTTAETVTAVTGIKAAVIDDASRLDASGSYRTASKRAILRPKDIPSISPREGDRLLVDGASYTVAKVMGDPNFYHDLLLVR